MVEKHDDKKHFLMILYQKKGEQVIKSVRKTVKKLLPSKIKLQASITRNKHSSRFNIKDKVDFKHKHDVKQGEMKWQKLEITAIKTRLRKRSTACFRKVFLNNL